MFSISRQSKPPVVEATNDIRASVFPESYPTGVVGQPEDSQPNVQVRADGVTLCAPGVQVRADGATLCAPGV
jgi:hypothetical protein